MINKLFHIIFPRLSFSHDVQNGHIVYSVEEFNKMITREQARADRGGNGFSLIVFELESVNNKNNLYTDLLALISRRIRFSDELGFISKKSLGALLVGATVESARKVASEIHRSISNKQSTMRYRVLSYPPDQFANNDPGLPKTKTDSEVNSQDYTDSGSMRPVNRRADESQNLLAFKELDPFFIPRFPFWKRITDIIGTSILILLSFPICLLVAIVIKIVSPGPVFFRQTRVGFMGKPFVLWKFRTMLIKTDTEDHKEYVCNLIQTECPMNKLDSCDPNIIPFIGKFIRSSGIDELPQLINVLRGEMSLVGPRPCIPYEFMHYLPWHRKRMLSVPGITGLWQVNGKNNTTFREMIGFDISYKRQMSLFLDLKILFKTIWVVFDQAFNDLLVKEEQSNATYI